MPAGTGIHNISERSGTTPVNVLLIGLPYFGRASDGVSVAVSFGSSRKP
jgi:hypothetical protein